jgi:hypothetical protein
MTVKIVKKILNNDYFTFNAMALLPSQDANEPSTIDTWAIFTHGYTASKRDCLPWAQRLAEAGIPAVIFDLPGHYLGSFHECESFEDFKEHAHECFINGFLHLKESLLMEGLALIVSVLFLGGTLTWGHAKFKSVRTRIF